MTKNLIQIMWKEEISNIHKIICRWVGRAVFDAESFFEGISEIGATFAGKRINLATLS
jgi:hypothetical protein